MIVRHADLADAPAMTDLQNAIIRIGGTTAHQRERSIDEVAAAYLTGSQKLCAHVATDGDQLLGFQVVGFYPDMPKGWGDIGTFVRPDIQRGGVGAALFTATLAWAREHRIVSLMAVIRADNAVGLGYYARRGFVDHGTEADMTLTDGRIVGRQVKRFDVPA
ncbi:MAG: GNAT family N-acetyltransferase [Paracoccaceae bacterium]